MDILFWVVFCGVALICTLGALVALMIDLDSQETYEVQGVRATTVMLFGFLVLMAVCLFGRRTFFEIQETTCPPPTIVAECPQTQESKDPSQKPVMTSVEESSTYFGNMVGGFVRGVMFSKEPETVPYSLSSCQTDYSFP